MAKVGFGFMLLLGCHLLSLFAVVLAWAVLDSESKYQLAGMRAHNLLLAATVLGLCVGATAAHNLQPRQGNHGHRVTKVTHLPGWDGPLPYSMWSGFIKLNDSSLPAGTSIHYHFTIIESGRGEGEEVPVVQWQTGGPGGPSLLGLFEELGPYQLNQGSYVNGTAENPALVYNPEHWARFSTLIAFDSPPPIGFSYCDPPGPAGNGLSCGNWTDERYGRVQSEGLHLLVTELFPDLLGRNRSLWEIGESYAGVYISKTAQEITTNPRYAKLNYHFQGAALGDACMGSEQICSLAASPFQPYFGPGPWLEFFYGHGQISIEKMDEIRRECPPSALEWGGMTGPCNVSVFDAYEQVGRFQAYYVYSTCGAGVGANNWHHMMKNAKRHFGAEKHSFAAKAVRGMHAEGMVDEVAAAAAGASAATLPPKPWRNGYWCDGLNTGAFSTYMNLPSVRVALGIPENANFFLSDNGVGFPYTQTTTNAFAIWPGVINRTNPSGRQFRLMSYNGDADPAVNTFETQRKWWAFARNYSLVKTTEWVPWMTERPGVVGGQLAQWNDGQVSYSTLRGSGHMAPEFRPYATYKLISSYVNWTFP